MGDRTILKNVVKSLIDSDPNLTSSETEATLAVAVRHVAVPIANFNTNTNNVIIAALSQGTYSANTNVDVTSAGFVCGNQVIVSTSNFIKLNFWKRNTLGLAKTNFATINTAALSANVNAYVIAEAANVTTNTNATNIARNSTVGVDIVRTTSGAGGPAGTGVNPVGIVFVTLKAK